jgi:peptidoglycan/xylan/chitin deacetylase (PgdA/CDA1 family)
MSNMILRLFSIFTIILAFSVFLTFQIGFGTGKIIIPPLKNGFNSSRIIILAFDDSPKSQYTLAKPVLDKYGFKGNFFTVCNFVNRGSENIDKSRMSWQDIKALQQQGHDIESHTMTHTDLDNKSIQSLDYEIGGSRQCLLNHGIDSTVFAYPASTGSYNSTIVNVVAKYYDLARSGDAPLAFLHCDGYKKEDNCSPFNRNGELKYENKYDIRNWSDRPKVQGANQLSAPFDNLQMLNQFIEEVTLQSNYNKNGCINAVPIVVYHDFLIDKNHIYLPNKSFTDVGLFSEEMKYLHDSGFIALKMSDIGYNPSNNYLYLKGPTNEMMRIC